MSFVIRYHPSQSTHYVVQTLGLTMPSDTPFHTIAIVSRHVIDVLYKCITDHQLRIRRKKRRTLGRRKQRKATRTRKRKVLIPTHRHLIRQGRNPRTRKRKPTRVRRIRKKVKRQKRRQSVNRRSWRQKRSKRRRKKSKQRTRLWQLLGGAHGTDGTRDLFQLYSCMHAYNGYVSTF